MACVSNGMYNPSGTGTVPIGTNVILSHHDYDFTPPDDVLDRLVERMMESGADICKACCPRSGLPWMEVSL